MLTRKPIALESFSWWARAEGGPFQRYEVAGRRVPGDWSGWARSVLNTGPDADWIEYCDPSAVTFRAAHLHEDRIESCVFIGPRPQLPSRTWLADLFDKSRLTPAERCNLLTGRPPDPAADRGALVCACFGVGRHPIEAAICQGCHDVAALGRQLKAGTNCGSCIPELRRMIEFLAPGLTESADSVAAE